MEKTYFQKVSYFLKFSSLIRDLKNTGLKTRRNQSVFQKLFQMIFSRYNI
jgi:hypothetical protein